MFRIPRESEVLVVRKARMGVVEDDGGKWCVQSKVVATLVTDGLRVFPRFLCPHFVMVRRPLRLLECRPVETSS